MKLKVIVFALISLFMSNTLLAQVSFGIPEKINHDWKFRLADLIGAAEKEYSDKEWDQIDLPHDWSIRGQLSPDLFSCTGYLPGGIGWYRKELQIPASRMGEKVYLYFEGIYNRSEVYVNGKRVGARPNGYISCMYDISPYVDFGSKNVVAVRVDHSKAADSRWYTGSGIYRDAWLVYANPVHIAQWGVFAHSSLVTESQANELVEVEVENGSDRVSKLTVLNELYDSDSKLVAQSTSKLTLPSGQKAKVVAQLKVKHPVLWELQHPVLYQLKTKILEHGKLIDQTVTPTGFRTFTFDPNKGFALNGKWMKMKGVCVHHDAGVLGAASYREVWKRRLMQLKSLGVNAIRTSHNPQSPQFYSLCDELGLLVLNEAFDEWEFPKRKWLSGWNQGVPGFEGSSDIFKDWGERDLADMVRRDRNHVSVFAWSIGNEVDYPNDPYSHPILDGGRSTGFTQPVFGGYKKDAPNANRLGDIAKRLAAVVRQYDTTRPVTAGLAGVAMSNETDYPGALDLVGYNYTENRYAKDHLKYPKRIIYGSENRHDYKAWKSVKENEFIFGQFLWTGIDYLGESGEWPSRGFYSGLLDLGGFIKPRGYFRQSLWSDRPMAYLGTSLSPLNGGDHRMVDVWSQLEAKNKSAKEDKPSMDAWPIWNYEDGQLVRVLCYTNAAKAKLMLNGKQVGELKDYDDKTGIIYWDIAYQQGKLEVVGLDRNGEETVRNALYTSGRPFALAVANPILAVEKDGVAQLEVNVLDENGREVILADNEISCQIEGEARLLGMEGSNNKDMSSYTDNVQRVYHGKLIAYVQPTGNSGTVKVRFSSPLLKSVEVAFRVTQSVE